MGNKPSYVMEHGYNGPPEAPGVRYRPFWPVIREADETWLDPPVKDGESVASGDGKDLYYRADQYPGRSEPGTPLAEYQEQIYRANPQVQDIMKKWDISPEHPGLEVNLGYAQTHYYHQSRQGVFPSFGLIRKLGPNYYDSPEGQNCHEKIFALLKNTAYWMIPVTVWDAMNLRPVKTVAEGFKRYPVLCVIPMSMAATFGTVTCLSCATRQKDDPLNYTIGGFLAALPLYIKYNSVSKLFGTGVPLAILATAIKIAMHTETGFSGKNFVTQFFPSAQAWRREWTYRKVPDDPHSMELRKLYGISP